MISLKLMRGPVNLILKQKSLVPKQIVQSAANIWTEPVANKSSGKTKKEVPEPFRDPIRQVFISQSTDVFSNLALEDWIYRNHDFDHKVSYQPLNLDTPLALGTTRKVPTRIVPKVPKLKNWAQSGPDSPPQSQDIALDRAVRLDIM